MKTKKKKIVYMLLLILFLIHIYFIFYHFWKISGYLSVDNNYDFYSKSFHLTNIRPDTQSTFSSAISSPCLTLYSVIFLKTCALSHHDIIERLSIFFNKMMSDFSIDERVMNCGLPYYFCKYALPHQCSYKYIKKICQKDKQALFNTNFLPKIIEILVTIKNDLKKPHSPKQDPDTVGINCTSDTAITWEISSHSDCSDINDDIVIHTIKSYKKFMEEHKMNSAIDYLITSWTLLSVTRKPGDLSALLQELIVVPSFHQINLEQSQRLGYLRMKRSNLKPSLNIPEKNVPSTAKVLKVPPRTVIFPSTDIHMVEIAATPTFSSFLPPTVATMPSPSKQKVNSLSVSIDMIVTDTETHTNTKTFPAHSQEEQTLHSSGDITLVTESGSGSGLGSETFGLKMLSSSSSKTMTDKPFYSTVSSISTNHHKYSHAIKLPTSSSYFPLLKSQSSMFPLFHKLQYISSFRALSNQPPGSENISSSHSRLFSEISPSAPPSTVAFIPIESYATILPDYPLTPRYSISSVEAAKSLSTVKPSTSLRRHDRQSTHFTATSTQFLFSTNAYLKTNPGFTPIVSLVNGVVVSSISPFSKSATTTAFSLPAGSASSTSTEVVSFAPEHRTINLVAVFGKLFTVDIPSRWKHLLKNKIAKIELAGNNDWLSYNPTDMNIVGIPLYLSPLYFSLLVTLKSSSNEYLLPPLSLMMNIQVKVKGYMKNPPYIVQMNCTLNDDLLTNHSKNSQSALALHTALFLSKITAILPHVYVQDLTILNANLSTAVRMRNSMIPAAGHAFYVAWFIEKFNYRAFFRHYQPLLLDSEANESSKELFFALLPEFVLYYVGVVHSSSVADYLDPGLKNVRFDANLSVILPVILVVCFMMISAVILIFRHKRKRLQCGRGVIDKTFSNCRKPVCLLDELELTDFHPSKPRILAEDVTAANQCSLGETIFSMSQSGDHYSDASVDAVFIERPTNCPAVHDNESVDMEASGPYSFVNAGFVRNDDSVSIESDVRWSSHNNNVLLLAKKAR